MRHLHVIPVIPGMTADETWAELCAIGFLSPPAPANCHWAQIHCDGQRCHHINKKVTR